MSLTFYPAIDLKDGNCVRLLKGEMDQATIYNESPANQAAAFEKAGCEFIHIVDLNGAFAGEPVNADAVKSILKTISVPIQLGGGIRTMETIDFWLSAGVSRVILGTVALEDPELVKAACKKHPGKIAVGVDARDGKIAVKGWAETADIQVEELAKKFEDAGVAVLIHTDIDRDGALTGANVAASAALAKAVSIPVIVSGGVASTDDLTASIEAAKDIPPPGAIDGVISGRALYDGRLDLKEALSILKGA